jgi:bifunctional ADP-heptose synthase (sugar kinase/adenylyltransferase)
MITVIQKSNLEIIESKIFNFETIKNQVAVWKFLNEKIVFTYGCFDVIDGECVDFLSKAADNGHLVVGLYADSSSHSIKSDLLHNQHSRALVLAGLQFVKSVVIFGQDTPLELIQLVEPNFLTSDFENPNKEVVGAEFIKAKGGEILAF